MPTIRHSLPKPLQPVPSNNQTPPIRIPPPILRHDLPNIILNIPTLLHNNQLPPPIPIRQRRPPRQIIDLPRQLGAEIARMRSMRHTSAAQHRRLPIAQSSVSRSFLRSDLSRRAVDIAAPFRGRGALPRGVAFEDDGAVEEVFPEREVEVCGGVGCEA